ncbi:MAG TPA: GxxExxY protein [bacterium]|jgi:GxxExxY protein|nr:GxxExxY protein [bacterium]
MDETVSRLELNRIARKIIGCAYEVGKHLKYGYLEKVYENALVYEIRKSGLKVQQQHGISVKYKDIIAGEYAADLLVESCVLVELKTAKAIDAAHIAQCLNYLTATDLRLGLLINFGEGKIEFKRLVHHF